MNKKHIFAVLLCLVSMGSKAEGYFIGTDASLVSYPKWLEKINSNAIANGASSAYSEQQLTNTGIGIRGGQWLNENFAWEVGYDDLGTVTGSTGAWFPGYRFGMWSFSAKALHLAALGGVKLGRTTLYGKLGLHSASTNAEGVSVVTNQHYSQDASSTGLLFGIGYAFPFSQHLSGQVAVDVFNGVKFPDPVALSSTTKEQLIKTSFGLTYNF